MAEYDIADLPTPQLTPGANGARTLTVALTPGGTPAHLAALHLEGAGAFARLCEANGVIDPIPYNGLPPRSVRRVSLIAGQFLALPEADL